MPTISNELKTNLGNALVSFYRRYGKVAPRRPYKDEDDSGGGAGLLFETHPLLAEQPVGAASDLTAITTEHENIDDLAAERANECNAELKKQPAIQQALGQQISSAPTPPTPTQT
jgi:hypothetical protein